MNEFYSKKHQAIASRKSGDIDSALLYIDEALRIRPTDMELTKDKAEILYKKKNYKDSIIIFKSLLSTDKGNISYIHGYYKCLYRLQEKLTEVDLDNLLYIAEVSKLKYFEKNLILSHNEDSILKGKINDYFSQYELSEIIQSLGVSEMIEYISKEIGRENKRNKIICEELYERELYDDLFEFLSEKIDIKPTEHNNYLLYASYKAELFDYEDAIAVLNKYCIENKKNKYLVYDKLTELHIVSGNTEKAWDNLKSLEKYLDKKEIQNAKVGHWKYKSIANLYKLLGDDERSEYYLQKYQITKSYFQKKEQ